MKIGISACSNGHLPEWQDQITELEQVLDNMNIETALSPHIMRTIDEYSGTDKERAEDLMKFYTDDAIDAICDISGGESGQIGTLFNQLDDMGVFDQISGVLLGTFTGYEKAGLSLSVYDLLKMHISDTLPVACTRDIGHGHDAKAIMIGKEYSF